LRELNNNTAYTEEYVAAGKKAIMAARSRKKRQKKGKKTDGADENVKLPRLIVEFTVCQFFGGTLLMAFAHNPNRDVDFFTG
jgi:hypothetical protein